MDGKSKMIKPNVIVCNLPIPGSSAIDLILREIFKASGYFITPFGSTGSHSLLSHLDEGKVSSPFYHWSDRSISCFDDLISNQNCKFIYLHCDPRNAAISWAHFLKTHDEVYNQESFSDVLEMVVTHIQPPHLSWFQLDCLKVKIENFSSNTSDVIFNILDYVQYFDDQFVEGLSRNEIHEIIKKHSFEWIAGHPSGQSNPEIKRSNIDKDYRDRSRTTEEWKNHYSEYLLKRVDALFGEEITQLGYQGSHTKTINVVSPPFASGRLAY